MSSTDRETEGERQQGDFQILEGGRAILLTYHDVRRVYRIAGPLNVVAQRAPEPELGQTVPTPNRNPDFVLACRPVSVRERTVTSNSNHTSNSNYGSSGSSYGSNSSVTEQCRDSNWQERRLSIPIWSQDRICGNVRCNVTAQSYSWPGVDINRYSGQLLDQCFVWSCTRSQGNRLLE